MHLSLHSLPLSTRRQPHNSAFMNRLPVSDGVVTLVFLELMAPLRILIFGFIILGD